MWDVGCGMWDVGCGMWDVGCIKKEPLSIFRTAALFAIEVILFQVHADQIQSSTGFKPFNLHLII
jgi:hypothetical protein